jgi:hypothetical protein
VLVVNAQTSLRRRARGRAAIFNALGDDLLSGSQRRGQVMRLTKQEKEDHMLFNYSLIEPEGDPPRFHCPHCEDRSYLFWKGFARHLKRFHLQKED